MSPDFLFKQIVGISLGAWVTMFAPAAFSQDPARGLSIAPGVLVDPGNGVAYVMTPRRTIDAVSLSDGELLWSSAAAAKPLAIRGNRLLAHVENPEPSALLTIAALGTEDGELVSSDSRNLGSRVVASVDDGEEYQFLISTDDADTATGPLLWRYYEQKLRGPEEAPIPVEERFGALNVSESAALSIVVGGGFSRDSGRPPYARPRITRPLSAAPTANAVIRDLESGLRFRADGSPLSAAADAGASAVSEAGSTVAATTRMPAGGLLLPGVPSVSGPPTVNRIPGDQFAASIDGRHIAASSFAGDITAAEPYRWTVYERESLKVVATYLARTSLAPFTVAGDKVLYLRQPYEFREAGELRDYPPALVARHTHSGRIAWTHAVRDTRYRGPVPDQARGGR